jgi:hypothetical protein
MNHAIFFGCASRMRTLITVFAFAATSIIAGCQSDVARSKVTGKVTLDGAAVEKGLVTFVPADGNAPSAKGGVIENGQYSAEVPAGEMTVRITAPKVVGKRKRYDTPDSPVDDILEERIPKKYNVESTLKEIIKGGPQEINFKLESK